MSNQEDFRITRRRLPHIQQRGAIYFVTFRVLKGELSETERKVVLEHLVAGHNKFYQLFAAIVMPDHVHAVLRPAPEYSLTDVMKGTKGSLARKINKLRNTTGSLWQDESYDRVIRDDDELVEKVNYTLHNSVRAGLVGAWQDYPYHFQTFWG